MKVEKITYELKCVIPGCESNATYLVSNEEIEVSSRICLCEKCSKELYKLLGKQIVPKSPKNILNKTEKR